MATHFSPPLYLQRYQFVIEFVKKARPQKVIDLGCSDCRLLKKLRFHRYGVELLAGVDMDCGTIQETMHELAPLVTDYLQPSTRPLTIELYQGSVTEREPCTQGFDLVTCIELMEHLQLWEMERFSDVVFGFMVPRAVIISMPNVEFNPLLPGLTGFRHKDHKFEWTRGEFQAWALGVCSKYGYSVEFTGVGEGPASERDLGFCSQIGVFHKNACDLNPPMNNNALEPTVYRRLYKVVYPSLSDNNILQRTLISEVLYVAERLKQEYMADENRGNCDSSSHEPNSASDAMGLVRAEVYRQGRFVCVPLLRVWANSTVQTLCGNVQQLRETLLDDSRVQLDAHADALILTDDEDDDADYEAEEYDEGENIKCVLRPTNDLVEDWESELE